MAGWLHGVFVGEWLFVFPLCGFSLSLFCNYVSGARVDLCSLCAPCAHACARGRPNAITIVAHACVTREQPWTSRDARANAGTCAATPSISRGLGCRQLSCRRKSDDRHSTRDLVHKCETSASVTRLLRQHAWRTSARFVGILTLRQLCVGSRLFLSALRCLP